MQDGGCHLPRHARVVRLQKSCRGNLISAAMMGRLQAVPLRGFALMSWLERMVDSAGWGKDDTKGRVRIGPSGKIVGVHLCRSCS